MASKQNKKESGKHPERRSQEERKAESERQIIKAAIRIFATQGYLRSTLNEIGESAGYTGGLVSHRFGSKAGLLHAVIEHISSRFYKDQLGETFELPKAEAAILDYIEVYMKEVTVREGPMRALYVIMGEALGGEEEIQKEIATFNQQFRDTLASIVQQGIDNGEFRKDIDPQAAGVLIMGMLRGVVMQYLFDRKAYDTKRIIPMLQSAALDGLK